MATNFRLEIGDAPSFLGLAFHNGWQDGKADGRVNSAEVLSTSYKNLVNFGLLTPVFTVMVWRPFMREIVETRSILEPGIRQWMAGTADRICAKFTRLDEFECQRSRSPGTDRRCVLTASPRCGRNGGRSAVVADNVAQAADATIRSLQRGVFDGMHAIGLAVYRLPLDSATHFCSVLFLSLPRSEGWPHHGRTFSIYLYPLSF